MYTRGYHLLFPRTAVVAPFVLMVRVPSACPLRGLRGGMGERQRECYHDDRG
jgi:hypothetical protein